MRAKDVEFDVTYIDLRKKPDWFLKISPHGKVPVLLVDEQPLFESNAIAEYLDEVVPPRLHPEDAFHRARNRAWTDFVPTFAAAIGKVNYGTNDAEIAEACQAARGALDRLEEALATSGANEGGYFNGAELSLVDAAYAPFLQRFAIVEPFLKTGLLGDYPRISAWADVLLKDERVTGALASEFPEAFRQNLERRGARAFGLMSAAA